MEDKIKRFVDTEPGHCSGDGSGSGTGYGYGSGTGDGYVSGDGSGSGYGSGTSYGYGYGSGTGYGYGYGDGDGSGDGDGLILNGHKIYDIDDVPTILYHVFGNFAKGAVMSNDLTVTDCYIAKAEGQFAHGATIHEARDALTRKLLTDRPIEERINEFVRTFRSGSKYENKLYYKWHNILTGSCKFGRDSFVRDHEIDLDGEMTPEEFILLTENAYGGNIIRKLKPFYNMKED